MNVKYLTKWLIGYRYNVVIISYSIACYFSDLREVLSPHQRDGCVSSY